MKGNARSDRSRVGVMERPIEPNYVEAGSGPAGATLLLHLHEDDPQVARVSSAQQLLFPASPQTMCADLGLNWWAAVKLFDDGWLSFSPETTNLLDDAQEAELRFVGSLVLAGCDQVMLSVLLGSLPRPYAYDIKRIYFDWMARRWRVLPDPSAHPEAAFTDWLEALVKQRDIESLSGIGELAQDALSRLRIPPTEDPPFADHWRETVDDEETQG